MTQFGTNPTYNYETRRTFDMSLSNSLKRLISSGKVQSKVLSATNFTWIEEANPTTNHASAASIPLRIGAGTRSRGWAKFDISPYTGKVIHYAYFAPVNVSALTNNETRTVTVSRVVPTATQAMTWNTYDGAAAWGSPGGLGGGDQAGSFADTVFRPTAWEDTFYPDMTGIVQTWVANTNPNNGILFSASDTLDFFSNNASNPGYTLRLVIVYSDDTDTHGLLTDEDKITRMYSTMHQFKWSGGNTWSSGGSANGMAIIHSLGAYSQYRTRLATFVDMVINTGGGLVNGITSYYMGPPFGEAIIYLHGSTGNAKYKTGADTMKDWILNTATRSDDGIIMENNKTETELIYCALPFLACHAQTYGDADKSIATFCIDQALRMYALLLDGVPDGIPYHLRQPGVRKGRGWGRGMGWILGGTGKLMRYSVITDHPRFPDLRDRFVKLAADIAKFQRPNGMWGGVIHDSSYADESSGTALIALGYEVGCQFGILDKSYFGVVDRAISGLLSYSKTGHDLANNWGSNQDLDYKYKLSTDYQRNTFGVGFLFELLMNTYRR